MQFKVGNPGCPCCGCDSTLCCKFTISTSPFSPGTPIPGVPVTFKDSGGTTVGTCTTDATGQCCINITVADTYTISYPGGSTTQVLDCNAIVSKTIAPTGWRPSGTVSAGVCSYIEPPGFSCCPSPDIPVTFTFSGGLNLTFTETSCAGLITFPIPPSGVPITLTVSAPGHITQTVPFTGSYNAGMVPTSPLSTNYCLTDTGCLSGLPGSLQFTTSNFAFFWGTINAMTVTLAGPLYTVPTRIVYSTTYINGSGNAETLTVSFDDSCTNNVPGISTQGVSFLGAQVGSICPVSGSAFLLGTPGINGSFTE